MRDFLTVFRYTFLEHLRKKSFIISTAILLVIAVAVMLLPSMISTLQSGGGGADEPGEGEAAGVLYVLDEGGLLGGALDGIRAASPGYDVKEAVPAEKDALAGRIAEEDGLYLLVSPFPTASLPSTIILRNTRPAPVPTPFQPRSRRATRTCC